MAFKRRNDSGEWDGVYPYADRPVCCDLCARPARWIERYHDKIRRLAWWCDDHKPAPQGGPRPGEPAGRGVK